MYSDKHKKNLEVLSVQAETFAYNINVLKNANEHGQMSPHLLKEQCDSFEHYLHGMLEVVVRLKK